MYRATIRSIADLAREVESLHRETRLRWWFRGHADADWLLLPSVRRDYTHSQEQVFSHEFRARAGLRYARCPKYDDPAGWLPLMQHYGLPTRLLDWSSSASVAAFFAAERAMRHSVAAPSTDACIWAVAPGKLNEAQELEPLIYTLGATMLHDMLSPAFYGKDGPARVAAARMMETDIRMQVQQGSFTIHTSDTPLNEIPGSDLWLQKFLIPMESVATIARELEFLGIRLADLFPDLTHLARELKGYYPPKPPRSPT